jgi:predicted amidohydrolase/glycosyltransferase involved in cell wall biosynthesis
VRIGCVTWPVKAKGSVACIESNAYHAIAAIRRLYDFHPDLICLPEGFLSTGVAVASADKLASDVSSSLLRQFASAAGALGSYLVIPFLERNDAELYNAVAVFDRSGRVQGIYRKRILWPSNHLFTQFEHSAIPGDGGQPFEADFGSFGVQVCIEMHWPGPWRRFRSERVRLILFPSEQSGGMLLRHRAWQSRAFVVSAVSKGGPSQVIDPVGRVVAEWLPETPSPVIDLGLDFELVHFDHNERKIKKLAAEYKRKISFVTYKHERLWRVTSCDRLIDLGRLLTKHEILPLDDYLRRVKVANDTARLLNNKTAKREDVPALTAAPPQTVSVIIPTLGIPATLPNCLRSLQAQKTRCQIEIIVVLNGPNANIVEFDWPGITIAREVRPGPAAARNAGVRLATGDFLAFIDSDCVATPVWLESAVTTAITCRNRCIVAGAIARPVQRDNWIRLFDRLTYLQQERYVDKSRLFVTANVVVPRKLFQRVGFFDEAFGEAACEDWEWALRAGRRGVAVVYDAGAVVHHPSMSSLSQLRAKAERLVRGEIVLRNRIRRRMPRQGLWKTMWRQLRRSGGDQGVSLGDRFRVVCVGIMVAYWSWREECRSIGRPATGPHPLKRRKRHSATSDEFA